MLKFLCLQEPIYYTRNICHLYNQDFQEEYRDHIMEMEDGAFAAGILFPALPVNLANGLGLDLVQSYLDQLPSRS